MSVSSLHFDILACIAENLDAKTIVELSSSCRAFSQLARFDLLWKRLCKSDYRLTYNDPEQSYRDLYRQTSLRSFGRRPCHHLSNLNVDEHLLNRPSWNLPLLHENSAEAWLPHVSCCQHVGVEKMFLCMQCHQLLCDRHSRIHAKSDHALFLKPSTAEIFCQCCVDWLGGNGADPAERYYASLISTHWINKVYLDSTFIEDLLVLRSRRQYERWIRWQDTPTRIVMSPRGFCFVSAQFIWEWERFIEGWRILPPVDEDATVVGSNIHIHSRQEQQEGVELSPLRFDPFLPESTDLHIVSHETWDYLSQNYSMTGPKITKDDLMHSDIHKQWQYTIKRYADRVMLRF